jgi:hypothetical protein
MGRLFLIHDSGYMNFKVNSFRLKICEAREDLIENIFITQMVQVKQETANTQERLTSTPGMVSGPRKHGTVASLN